MKTYRIKDWANAYENNRTRELKYMDWIPIPNRHDGDGYTLLVDRENGAQMLGAWLAILQVASKCDPRGTLLRDSATPHDSASIGRITRIPKAIVQQALDILVNECKWVEIIGERSNPAPSCDNPAPSCGEVTTERNGTERNYLARSGEIPTFEEVKQEADIRCIPEASAKVFFDHHQDNSLWLNQFGRLINWRSKLTTWSVNDRQPKPNKPNATNRPTAPDRNAGTYNDKPLSAAARAKVL